jgi:hypothetical protein
MMKQITLPLLLTAGFASADRVFTAVHPELRMKNRMMPAGTSTADPASLTPGSASAASRTVTYSMTATEKKGAASAIEGCEYYMAELLIAALDEDIEKIARITVSEFKGDPETGASVDGEYKGDIKIEYATDIEAISNAALIDEIVTAYEDATDGCGGAAGDLDVVVTATAVKGHEWEVTGDAEADSDAVDKEYRTVEYTMQFTSSVDLKGSENFMSQELATELLTLDESADAIVSLTTTTLSGSKNTAARRLNADTWTYTLTATVVYASLAASKLDLGLPALADKGAEKLQTILDDVAEANEFVIDDDESDDYIEITSPSMVRVTPLVKGDTASRTDLTTSSDSEESRTLTVSGEFTSTKKFTSAEIADLEGSISNEMMDLDTADNILSVTTDVAEQSASTRRLLATYSYDSTSTVVTVSATAATDAKTLLSSSLTADGFKTILADAATAAGITGATFTVAAAPGIVGGAASASGASAAILGGALGLFAAVAALL